MTSSTNQVNFDNRLLRFCINLVLGLAILTGFVEPTLAQVPERPDRGIRPIGSYSVNDIEAISLTNGNVNLSIPLASLLPMAGGKLSWALRGIFNSKLWDTTKTENQTTTNPPVKYIVTRPQLSDQGGGWRIGTGYDLAFRESRLDFDWITPGPGDPDYPFLLNNPSWYKVILTTPDGANHELRPTDYQPYSGTRDHLRGYYSQTPTTLGQTMRYYSVDGSYLWATVNPPGQTIQWAVYQNDGTSIVQYSNGFQEIIDANRNAIRLYWGTDPVTGLLVRHIEDSVTGREITYTYDPDGNGGNGQGLVRYQTVGGTWITITVNFGYTTVRGKIYQVEGASGCLNDELLQDTQVTVIRSIILPQTQPGVAPQQFTFNYRSDNTHQFSTQWRPVCPGSYQPITLTSSNGWGELGQMLMPAGATVTYTYSSDLVDYMLSASDIPESTITKKEALHDGVTDDWDYSIGVTAGTVEGPDGSITIEHFYSHNPGVGYGVGGSVGLGGLVYRTERSGKVRTERRWVAKQFDGSNAQSPGGLVPFNPVVEAEYTTLLEGNPPTPVKMSAKKYQYDFNGSITQTTEYDWFDPALVIRDSDGIPIDVPGGSTPVRTTANSYYNPATASNSPNVYAKRSIATATPLILSALQEIITGPSQTRFSYDHQAYGAAPTIGNLTQVSRLDDSVSPSQWRDTNYNNDGYGNRISITDPNGNVTNIFYDPATAAQPTQIRVDPLNGTGTQTTLTSYDYSTGLVISQTDPNGQATTTSYINQLLGTVDPFGRPGVVTGPQVNSVVNGVTYANQQLKVKTTYYDDPQVRQVVMESDLNQTGDYKLKTRTSYDQLGRVIKTESNEDGTSNWTISSQNVYVQMGLITLTSNPKRSAAASTDGWTRATRDTLGRVTEVATFLGASQPPNSGTNSNWTGSVTTSYYANQTTVTDQAGKVRRSLTDGLGRLSQVIEDPNGLNYQTNYTYDTLSNLRKVEQGAQTRHFAYDSLSRLIYAMNPEQTANAAFVYTDNTVSPPNSQWSMKYTYYANGNLWTRVDARNLTTTYTYDGLNRNTTVDYSDSTPDITRTYDTATNGKGRLRKTETAGSAGSRMTINSYDAMGRTLSQSQQFYYLGAWGSSYTMQHTYNLAGGVTSQTYPSGRTTTTNYDSAGRLNTFSGYLGDGVNRNYVTGTTVYTATGQMTQEQFGTTTTLYHRRHFNSRGQMYDVRLGTGAADDFSNATWNRGAIRTFYSSNLVDFNTPPTGQLNNNGNVYRQDHFVPLNDSVSDWVMSVDNYSYDALNRLTGVSEAADSYISGVFQETYPYAQYFNYDRYGNRTLSFATTGAASGPGATFINDTVWVEDAMPAGATAGFDGGDNWTWVSGNPSPVSGSLAHQSNVAAGEHQHFFTGATATLQVNTGDKLFAYVYLDPANMPSEVMLQWNENGSWEHRAYWGANNIAWGVDGTASRRNMGLLPPNGGWMRLEVPASLVGLEGKTVTGMAFTLYGGRATWDRAGKSAQPGGSINNRPFNVDEARNRLLAVSGTMQYDAAGNLNYDNYTTPLLGQRNYDAENKMTAVYNNSGVLQHSYYYDGDGRRARRIINSVETWQIYGIGGELVAEYAAGGATNAPQKEYGYRGGQLLITAESSGTVKWLVSDQLGTPRMVVDKSGTLSGANGIVRHDYLPFGEEISAGVGIRSTGSGYGTDTVRQKFTGKERDSETGLDYFLARYHSSVQGRFTSPDEFTGGPRELFIFAQLASSNPTFYADLTNPQSLNKYQYTYNNPPKFTDPDGHCPVCVVAAVAAVAFGASTVNAPGPKDPVYESEGAGPVIAGVFMGEAAGKFIVGPLFRYAGSKLFTRGSTQNLPEILKPTVVAPEELSSAATIGRSIGQEVMKMERGQMPAIAAKVTEQGLDQMDAVVATQTAITTIHKNSTAVFQPDGNVYLLSRYVGDNQPVIVINKQGAVSTAWATVKAGVDKVNGAWFEIIVRGK